MIDVLFLQRLQRDSRFAQDLVLPCQKLGAKIIALAVVHERLFFGGSIILQLFQGQPIFICKANERFRSRAPYIAASCDRQYRWVVVPGESSTLPKALRGQSYPDPGRGERKRRRPSDGDDGAALSIANRKTLADMGGMLDFVGERDCEILEGNPAFSALPDQELVGPQPELARRFARHKQRRRRQEGP